MTTQLKQILLLIFLALSAYLLPISTSGAWLVLAPVAAVGSFFAGRYVASALHGIVALAVGALASGVSLLLSAHVSALTFALNIGTGVVLFVLLPWWAGRARANTLAFRAQERHHLELQAKLRERARIAEAMHDQLGHDMALLALSTGGLQVSLDKDSEAYQQAVRIRAQADEAVEHLHEIIEVLREPDEQASLVPSGQSVDRLINQARNRGMQINYQLSGPALIDAADAETGAVVRQVLQETLTNAAKYAPQQPVRINIDTLHQPVRVRISNPLEGQPVPQRPGASGLSGLREVLERYGGSLSVNHSEAYFDVIAEVQHSRNRRESTSATTTRKQTSRWLLVLVPACAVAVMVACLYVLQLATFRATALSPADFQQLKPGMTRTEVAQHVQAQGLDQPLPVIDESQQPASGQCRYYAARTGVLDFGSEMFRLCFTDDVLTSAEHLYPAP